MVPGLINVMVTPGSTAPDSSTTVPPMAPTPWAAAGRGKNNTLRIATPHCQGVLVIGTSLKCRANGLSTRSRGLYARRLACVNVVGVLELGTDRESRRELG